MSKMSRIKNTPPSEFVNPLQEQVFSLLSQHNIPFDCIENEEVHSMEECVEIESALGVEIKKTIVLNNRKKTQFYLLVMPSDKPFNAKDFSDQLGCQRLSFASADRMETMLGVQPGSATIMSLLNDSDENVQLVLDQDVVNDQWFACNTGTNTCHIKLSTDDLLNKVIKSIGHTPMVVSL